jgi:hypothetical protein
VFVVENIGGKGDLGADVGSQSSRTPRVVVEDK